jgi:hypothetical protein
VRRTTLMGGLGMRFEMVGGFDWLGIPPGGRAYFLLLRQKKVAKEKATPGYAVGFANSPALLETGGGCGTRAAPSNSPRPLSAVFSVARRSTRGPKNVACRSPVREVECCGQPIKQQEKPSPSWQWTPLGPLRGAEQRRLAGGFRFAMFEPQASSGKPPGLPSSARNRATPGTDPGVAFTLLTFFWRSKRK